MPVNAPTHHPIVIIGAGFGGIGLGVRLREAGIDDFAILEREAGLGGTWLRNTYPGCACDVPSHLYCYSFAPNPDWSRTYATQPEILAYLRDVAQRFDVVRHMRFNTDVREARWDEPAGLWRLDTTAGPVTATVLVSAIGIFGHAAIPDIAGRDTFTGTQMHTLHWNHDHDLTGQRVAVVGTGASAVQVIPEIQPHVAHLDVFQRSAPWIVPRMDLPTSTTQRALLRHLPLARKSMRAAWYTAIEGFGLPSFVNPGFRHPYELLGHLQLRRQVRDPDLRRRLTPDYVIGCKRAIFSDAYYPALTQPNVSVVTEAIAEIRPHAIVTGDGVEHPVDTIIWGTGFAPPTKGADHIRGRDGRSIADVYAQRPTSYLGAAQAGFPNLFTLLGPFGAAGNQSAIYMIESTVTYIVDAIRTMRATGTTRVEVRPDVQDAFVTEMESRSRTTIWLTGGCTSYYTTATGHNAGLYPNWSFDYRRRTRHFDARNYAMSR
ncbi:NAD(P)/FAD-dependent oxidoreductase [Skermania sp. ID1734]|uniref:flavin-containing monooxygenase n=1 Tax=Skermania sp. ID1734 TaxID=2597516 RepID=UPI00117FBF14|nr:NAD(P)/FAD-dependent oxidoreductase [Skermania sp. ID1734]TSD93251.1 NAD(P)/FAD-dependent oxidoreductase [Skermania sp. ID1734]